MRNFIHSIKSTMVNRNLVGYIEMVLFIIIIAVAAQGCEMFVEANPDFIDNIDKAGIILVPGDDATAPDSGRLRFPHHIPRTIPQDAGEMVPDSGTTSDGVVPADVGSTSDGVVPADVGSNPEDMEAPELDAQVPECSPLEYQPPQLSDSTSTCSKSAGESIGVGAFGASFIQKMDNGTYTTYTYGNQGNVVPQQVEPYLVNCLTLTLTLDTPEAVVVRVDAQAVQSVCTDNMILDQPDVEILIAVGSIGDEGQEIISAVDFLTTGDSESTVAFETGATFVKVCQLEQMVGGNPVDTNLLVHDIELTPNTPECNPE